MSKSITNQRLVYKIHSSRFKYNDWNLQLSLEEAKQNEELVSLGDSIVLRMIRQIRNNNITEEEILEDKKRKKKAKEKSDIIMYSKKIQDETFEKDYLVIIFDTIDDWNKANSKKIKVMLNDIEYKRIVGTNGGIKHNSVVFVNSEIYDELEKKLNNGRNIDKEYVPAKFEAYKALAFSSSTPVTQPNKILVIKDGVNNFKEDVLRLYSEDEKTFKLKEEKDYNVELNFTDGCGMISPKLAEQWAIDLGEFYYDKNKNKVANYIPSGFNIRDFTLKGMVGTFPYIEYGDEIGRYEVEDIWGNVVDIRDVDLIITNNMLKLWDSYSSCDEYISCCEENGFNICVAKMLPKELENVRNMNYQFLQSYEFTDEDIDELLQQTVSNIKGAIGVDNKDYKDYAKMLLFLKGSKITENDFLKEDNDFIKALMIDKQMMNEPFIKQKIHKMIKKKIEDSKKGVIQVNGNYSIVFGDLYALCQHMFGEKITGCLKKGEFYSKTWLNKGVNKVIGYRAPMTIHNNITTLNLINNDIIKKYFRYMRVVTVCNAWDTTCHAMNGMDFDSDAIITTDNSILLKNTKLLPTVICEQNSAKKEKITEPLLRKANRNGFGNNVGKDTNRCTAMFDVLAKFEKGTKEYDEMIYRITCMQGYQQETIDSCKGIIPKQVPKEWYNYKSVKNSGEYLLKLVANKKPYFFIYNYRHLKNDYNKYIKANEDMCYLRFGVTISELENKQNKTQEELDFIKYYYDLMPISDNNSTMNRICHKLEKEFDNILPNLKNSEFDKSILMTDKKVPKKIKEGLNEIYKEYCDGIKSYMSTNHINNKKNENSDDYTDNYNSFKSSYIEKVELLCNGDYELICNGLVDLLYTNPVNKQFVWDICGEYLVDLLLKRNNDTISFPIKSEYGDIEWNGEKYKLINRKVENIIEDNN